MLSRWLGLSILPFVLLSVPRLSGPCSAASAKDRFGEIEIKVAPLESTESPWPAGGSGLDRARDAYQRGWWGAAFRDYKEVHTQHPSDRRDPEVLLMIADCAEKVREELHDVLVPEMDTPSYGRGVVRWLKRTYGLSIVTSEGDAGWHYDKRALRELLRRYPGHPEADAVAYALVREDLLYRKYDEAVFMVSDDRSRACARDFVARYEAVLRRYPRSGLRAKIESELTILRKYVESKGPAPAIYR